MSRNAVAFRRAEPRDVPALRSLHRASLGALGAAHYSPRQIAGLFLTCDPMEPALIADGTLFVAESAGRIVGSGAWTLRRPAYEAHIPPAGAVRRDPTATIRAIFVAPDRARQGVARAIMDVVEAEAVLHGGVVRLELMATLSGVEFYRTLGYAQGARVELPLVNGAVFPGVRMAKQVLPEGPVALAA